MHYKHKGYKEHRLQTFYRKIYFPKGPTNLYYMNYYIYRRICRMIYNWIFNWICHVIFSIFIYLSQSLIKEIEFLNNSTGNLTVFYNFLQQRLHASVRANDYIVSTFSVRFDKHDNNPIAFQQSYFLSVVKTLSIVVFA